jgi:hypothetical protein
MKNLLDSVRQRILQPQIPRELRGRAHEHVRLGNPWHAVSVEPGPRHCEAANALSGRRFLSKEAPRLPLERCSEAACSCRYQHYEDRRVDRRRLEFSGVPPPHPRRRCTD